MFIDIMSRLPVVLILLIMVACSPADKQGVSQTPADAQAANSELPGYTIYTKNCKLCHGKSGDLGLSGAANLRKSTLSLEEKIEVITNGRNGMAPHKNILTPDEIREVDAYITTLHE
jgi:mono/diheme cytochrome c family protein